MPIEREISLKKSTLNETLCKLLNLKAAWKQKILYSILFY